MSATVIYAYILMFEVSKICLMLFLKTSPMLNKAAIIQLKYSKNSNIVKCYYYLQQLIYFNTLIYFKQFIPVIAKLNFQQPLLKSPVSHDPSEIILICWFGAQETLPVIIKLKTTHVHVYDSLPQMETVTHQIVPSRA